MSISNESYHYIINTFYQTSSGGAIAAVVREKTYREKFDDDEWYWLKVRMRGY